jgi:hypothetical protein
VLDAASRFQSAPDEATMQALVAQREMADFF